MRVNNWTCVIICKISWQSVKPLSRYGDFSIFQNGGRRHLWFFSNFKFLTVGRLRRPICVGIINMVEIGQNEAEISRFFYFFQMAAAAILDFSNFKFLTVGRLKRAELRRRAKFGRNRSKRGRVMAIFRCFKMAAATILDFSNFKFLTVSRLKRAEIRRYAKFGRNP